MKKGFTLLELIIVIIIVGVLTSLALPRLFDMVEFSRSTEALMNLKGLRQAMEICYLMNNGENYSGCFDEGSSYMQRKAAIESAPNSHFNYAASYGIDQGSPRFQVLAYRNTLGFSRSAPEGFMRHSITLGQKDGEIQTCGTGVYSSIRKGACNLSTWSYIIW